MNQKKHRSRLSSTEVILGLFLLTVVAQLIRLLFFKKIDHLFVDDWAIFENFSSLNNGVNAINLEPYNGHSLIVTRIVFIFITETLGISVSTFSIILTFFFAGTLVALIKKTRLTVSATRRLVLTFSFFLIALDLNQYQNFTMPICWSWIICLILIFWTYIIANQEMTFIRGALLVIFSLLGPLTLSFGFIIPGFIILKTVNELVYSNLRFRKILFLTFIVLLTLFSYRVAIVNSVNEYGGFASPRMVLQEPLKAVIFVLTSIGAPFTPASRFSVLIASAFGILIAILLIKSLLKIKSTSDLFMDDSLITLGVIFHGIHLIGRFDGSWDSILIAAQPRYSTGGILLVLGVVLSLIKGSTRKTDVLLVFLVGALSISGIKTAQDFTSVRHAASSEISNCEVKFGLDSIECGKLLYPGPNIIDKVAFDRAINYLGKLNR